VLFFYNWAQPFRLIISKCQLTIIIYESYAVPRAARNAGYEQFHYPNPRGDGFVGGDR